MNRAPLPHGTEGYERLRSHALGGPAPEFALFRTLDVLLQNGLAVWMIFGSPALSIAPTSQPTESSLIPQRELALLLADMTEPFLLT